MIRHILVPVDGSPTSTAALHRAIELARACDATITVLMTYDPYPYLGAAAEYGTWQAQYLEDLRGEANIAVQAARRVVEDADIAVKAAVQEAHRTHEGILEVAASEKADLIVMGSHGRSGLDKLVMGSVTQRVLQHTHLPVLVVRE